MTIAQRSRASLELSARAAEHFDSARKIAIMVRVIFQAARILRQASRALRVAA